VIALELVQFGALLRLGVGALALELRDVGARHERLAAGTRDDQAADLGVGREVLEDLGTRRLAVSALWFALYYAALLGVDVWLVGDVLPLAVAMRIGIVVPLALWVAALLRGRIDPAWRDVVVSVPVVAAVATSAVVFLASRSPTAAHFHHLVVLPILYANIVQRPRLAVGAWVSFLTLAIDWGALGLARVDASIAVAGAVETAILVCFSLVAGHNVERELRRAYLMRLRSERAVDDLVSRNDELTELSRLDLLTGVANRRGIDAHLRRIAEWSRRGRQSIALLMIDVDHFKKFNDRYGHPEGDRCLVRVVSAAREQLRRNEDLFGRFGGEEFLAVLVGTDLAGALKVADRIRAAVEDLAIPHADSPTDGVVAVSIGCAAGVIGEVWSVDDLLQAADEALYAAKRHGRNRIHPMDESDAHDEAGGRARRSGAAA